MLILGDSITSANWITLPVEASRVTELVVSPDGEHIGLLLSGDAPLHNGDAYTEIVIIDTASGEIVGTSGDPGREPIEHMAWLPNASGLVYLHDLEVRVLEPTIRAEPRVITTMPGTLDRLWMTTNNDFIYVRQTEPNMGPVPNLFSVELSTGTATGVGSVSSTINPSEGTIQFLEVIYWDETTSTSELIDPATGEVTTTASFETFTGMSATPQLGTPAVVATPVDRGTTVLMYMEPVAFLTNGDGDLHAYVRNDNGEVVAIPLPPFPAEARDPMTLHVYSDRYIMLVGSNQGSPVLEDVKYILDLQVPVPV